MESERFEYFRNYLSGTISEANLERYGFILYGLIIFLVFPVLGIFENVLAVIILVVGKHQQKLRTILSRFGKTLRNMV